jgi:hypothetical protein
MRFLSTPRVTLARWKAKPMGWCASCKCVVVASMIPWSHGKVSFVALKRRRGLRIPAVPARLMSSTGLFTYRENARLRGSVLHTCAVADIVGALCAVVDAGIEGVCGSQETGEEQDRFHGGFGARGTAQKNLRGL